MIIDLKLIWCFIYLIYLTEGIQYYPACPSDDPVTDGCPNGWASYMELCYKLNTYPQKTYIDAKSYCNGIGAQLLRIDNLAQHKFISAQLDNNSVNRTIRWYTAGKMDPAKFGRYIWEGYIPVSVVSAEILSLFIDVLPDPSRELEWNKDRKQIVYGNDGSRWGFYITPETDLDYFICQAKKSQINQLITNKRTPDFNQYDLTNVKRGPCILTQPTDQLSLQMEDAITPSVTFTCEAYGNPMPTIKWFFIQNTATGVIRSQIDPLSYTSGQVSQTGGLLTIYNPDTTFDNKIECQVENDYGIVISKRVQIIRGSIGKYNKDPRQTKTTPDNQGFMLDCEAPQHQPEDSLSYTFRSIRRNDKGIDVEDVIQANLRNNLFLSTNLGLIGFSIATIKDTGSYMCLVGWKGQTSAGNTIKSPNIPLIVAASNVMYPAPKVQDRFPNFMPSKPLLGDTVEFECFGYGQIKQIPLYYIWSKDGVDNLPSKAILSDFGRRFQLRNVQFEDQGLYSCKIRDSDGQISVEKSVRLQINAKPVFLTKPTNQYLDLNQDVRFICRAVAQPQVNIRWYRNDMEISAWLASKPDPRYNFTSSNGQATLNITNVALSDKAMIGCVIENSLGEDAAFAQMMIFSFSPNFIKYPILNTEAMVGNSIIMPCQPEGAPAPSITWSFNGAQLSLSNSQIDPLTGMQACPNNAGSCILPNQNLRIDKVTTSNSGNYTCTATNTNGVASSSAILYVVNSLVVGLYPIGRRIEVDTNVAMPCQAVGTQYLDIDYDWYFENVRLTFDRYDMDARRNDLSQYDRPYQRYFGTMTIRNIQFYDEGNYTCKIVTPISSVENSALIKVIGPPGVGGGITINALNTTQTLQWTDGNIHGRPIEWYRIEVAKDDGLEMWYSLVDRINVTDVTQIPFQNQLIRKQIPIIGLPANTQFRLRVYAANSFGLGAPSAKSDPFRTNAIPPVKMPQNVTGGGGKVGTLVIRWNPLNSLDENGNNFGYDVQYKESKEIEWVVIKDPLITKIANYCQVTVTLPANKDYISFDVSVRAKNDQGPGPWSLISQITSASKLPQYAPQNVEAGSYNCTAITVQWTAPIISQGEGPILGFYIIYWLRYNDCKSQAAILDRFRTSQRLTIYGGSATSGTIIGLESDSYYCIGTQMFNSAGDSLESSFTDQTTFKLAPQNFPAMSWLNSTGVPHQIQVKWNGVIVAPNEESIDGYIIRYWESGAPVRMAKDVDAGLHTTAVVNDLQYDVRYNLRIFAYSRGGHGKLSNPMQQFMMIPKSRCVNDQVIDAADVRYVFICSSCRQGLSILTIIFSSIMVRLLL